MATGRKQKPRTLKVLQGTFRKDRANEAAPEPSAVVANAPAFLSGRALVWFGVLCAKLSPLGLASETFEETLGLLAARLAEIEELERFIRENGRSYTTTTAQGDVMCRPYPEVAMLNEARRHAHADDPVLTWMMGNVVLKQARGGGPVKYFYPTKERESSKIDGAVALIMAVGRALAAPAEEPEIFAEVW
ncbi:terminase TerL endonuclease subunit [Nitratidesulfovibrio sp. 1201_IL3209]|uniref:terminase TerL endonuclease subunit n=1 Tax=Nitratidesulfovibrio sp. 1201_IL3209 TaxID=3084053 RepID=UPI002FD92370